MARFMSDTAHSRLLAAGVEVVSVEWPGAEEALVAAVLPEGERQVREEVELLPPSPGGEYSAFGAWHLNEVAEVHTLVSGEGLFEFWVGDGVEGVVVVAGDVIGIRRVEHRYRPITPQTFVARFGGGPDDGLVAVETGRHNDPWPDVF